MTIEEMVKRLNAKWTNGDTDIEAIIAALRAGQEMYAALALDEMDTESTERVDRAMEAWDAATKGDEG